VLTYWNEYIHARKKGIKSIWKPLLEENLNKIESLPKSERNEFLLNFCVEHFDNNNLDLPIQHPKIWKEVLELWKVELTKNEERTLFWIYKSISYKDVYKTFKLNPEEILKKILASDSKNIEALTLLFKEKIETLDFATHELPTGLVIDEKVCLSIISECEEMINTTPKLVECKSRFNLDFYNYRHLFYSWIEYRDNNIKTEFNKWLQEKI